MENGIKRFLSLAMALIMVIGMMPLSVFATDGSLGADDGSDTVVADTDFTDATADESGEGWAWANESKTLTLNGAAITTAVTLPADSTIVVTAGTENSVKVVSGNAVSSDGKLAISGTGKLAVIADDTNGASAVVAPAVSITGTEVDLHGYYYGIQAKTTSGDADSVVTLTNVSGKIVGYGYGGINAHSETANVVVKLNNCHDLVINNEVTNDSTSVNFNFAGIRAYTRGNGKDVLVELNGCEDISISNSTMAILAANNANAANEEAANVKVLIKDSTGIELTGNTSSYSAVFVNNYGIENDDSSNLVIENSTLEVNAPNATALMTSTKSAPSEVDVKGSNLTITAGQTGIRTIASSADYADTDVTGSTLTFTQTPSANYVDESVGSVVEDEEYYDESSTVTDEERIASADAKVGENYCSTLQEAINACVAGDNTITLLTDCAETVTIKQTEGVNIVIDGAGKTMSGTIVIDGNGRPTGTETLTIKNVKFVNTTATTYAYFINAEKNAAGGNSQAHNVTVDNCYFESNNWHYAIGTRHPYNLVVTNCTANNVYYFIYNPQGGQKITVENCNVPKATYGIGAQKCQEVYVKDYTYTGKAAGFYGRSSSNASWAVLENVSITTTLNGQPAVILWKNDDGDTSKTYTFELKGNNTFTAPEGVEWFARQSETNSPYEIIDWGNAVAIVAEKPYMNLKDAVAAANAIEGGATVTLLQNVTLGEKLTITGNVTISGKATITRDDAYTGTLFTVNAGATLTLDGGLTIDGGNNYGFNSELYNADLEAMVSIPETDANKYFSPEEGAPVATAYMIVLTKGTSADAFGGTVNLNNVTIQNNYSINSGIVSAAQYTETNLNGAKITHVAATQASGVVVNASGAGIKVNMNEGTVIDGNHVGGNHGIFKIYSGTVFTMDGGEVKNTTGWNSNGNVVGLYGGTFIMNGGTICSNSAVYGPSNGRNAAIYLHSNSVMEMNGGTICHNTGRSRGGIDSSKTSSKLTITGGEVLDNISLAGNSTADIGGTVGTWEITGGTFTQDVSAWLAPNIGLAYDETTGTYGITERVWEMHLTDANGEAHWLSPMYGNDLAGIISSSKVWYDTLQGTYSFTLKLLTDVKIDATAVVDFPLTIDLNGKTITTVEGVVPAIRITNGADVTVKNGTMNTGSYCFILGASDGSSAGNLTIESGKYHGVTSVASVTKGTLTVLGGEFSVEPYNGSYEFLLNCIDANYNDGSAKIVVKGGSFTGFNPANNAAEGTGTNFVAEGYLSESKGDVYTVRQNKDTMEAVVTITFDDSNSGTQMTLKYPSERYDSIQKLIGTNSYDDFVIGATQSELLAYIAQGRASNIVMTLHDDIELDAPINFYNEYFQIAAEYGITIDGNGHTITWADGYNGTLINVESGVSVTTKNLTIDGENAFTFYNDTTAVENGQNWYTRFVNVGEEDKAVNANVIVNAGNLTLGEGTVIQNVTIATDHADGKTENTEKGYILKYNQDLAIIKSNGGTVALNGAEITGNAGIVLHADNAASTITNATITGNMGCGREGGILQLDGGSATISNSHIDGNKAMARCATILAATSGAVVTFENSTIDNNTQIGVGSNTAGSMVVVREGSKFVMNGGSISNNAGGRAGAIASRWATKDASIELNAGTITGNTASNDGWGNASIFLRSPATIGEGMTIDGNIVVNASPAELDITGGNFTGSLTVTDGLSAEISGGTFNYDPTEWLAEGYTVDKDGDIYKVRKETYVEWVQKQLFAGNSVTLTEDIVITDYDLVHAHAWPSNGNGKHDERHGNGAIFHVIKPGVVLDLNGHSITWDAHDADYCNKRQVSLFMVTITGNPGETADLTVKDSGNTGEVEIYGMGTGMYVVGVDAAGTIEGGTWTNYPCKTCSASNIFFYPSHGGKLYITGGTFEQKDSEYLLGWMGSTKETNNNGVGVDYDETEVIITGGTFVGFNPAEVKFFDYANGSQESEANGCAPTYVPVDNGDGTYGVELWNGETISNKYELQAFADKAAAGETFSGKTVKLIADIDFEWAEWTAVNFAGTFEGNNHTIKNLTYVPTGNGRMGFFQSISGPAKDLTLDGIKGTVPADGRFGGFARYLNAAVENIHVKNIEVTTTDTLAWVGGFTTYTAGGSTNNCSVENLTVNAQAGADLIAGFISLTANRQLYQNSTVNGFKVNVTDTHSSGCGVGGFVAQTQTGWNNPKFANCSVEGIDVTANGLVDVGGFVAWPGAHTAADNCTTEGKIDVTGVTSDGCFAGGFFGNLGWNADLGQMGHVVTNCSADVDITTKVATAGGFVGSATNSNNASMYATFTNCSAKGDITAVEGGTADIGGFFGDGDRGVYNFCTASGTVTNNGTGYSGTFGGALYDVTPKYDHRYPAGTRDYLVDEITLDNCTATGTATSGKFIGNVADGVKLTIQSYIAEVVETGVKYYTLTEALNACTNGETIKLIADIVYDADDVVYAHGGATGFGDYDQYNPSIVYIGGTRVDEVNSPSNVNAVLDLNGHTITNNANAYLFLIMDNAKLTFKDSADGGALISSTNTPVIWVAGTETLVTVESGKYTTASKDGLIWSTHGGDLVIKGGEFGTSADDASLLIMRNAHNRQNSAYFISGKATVTVTGGTFYGFNPEEMMDDSTTPFTQFNAVANGYKADENNGVWTVKPLITVTFDDFTMVAGNKLPEFTYTTNFTEIAEDGNMLVVEDPEVTVNGAGEYEITANAYVLLNDDYVVEVIPGTLTVTAAAAKIGDVHYATLAEAIAKVQDGETIVLLAENAENVTIKQTKDLSFTIDGANMTYTGTITIDGNKRSTGAETLTIQNVNFVLNGQWQSGIFAVKNSFVHNLTVDGCSFTGNDAMEAYGIRLHHAYNITVKNTTGTKLFDLVYGQTAVTGFTAENVTVTDSGMGFMMPYGKNLTFKNVNLDVASVGIAIYNYNASSATFENCTIKAETPIWLEQKNATNAYTLTFNGENNFEGDASILKVIGTDAMLKVVLNDTGLDATKASGLVANIGNVYYNTLANAIKDAKDGDTVAITVSHVLDGAKTVTESSFGYETLIVLEGKAIILDLNGKTLEVTPDCADANGGIKGTLESVIFVRDGASLTIQDSSESQTGGFLVKKGTDLYSLIYNNGSTLTIESGNFHVEETIIAGSLIYADGISSQKTTINGGVFTLGNASADGSTTKPWIINVQGKNEGFVEITGGIFNQNPWMNYGTAKDCEVTIADDMYFVQITEGEYAGYYKLAEAVAVNVNTGKRYGDLSVALTEAQVGQTVKLVRNVEVFYLMVFNGITLDLNGFALTTNYLASFGDVVDNSDDNAGVLKVPKKQATVHVDNDQLPVWNADLGGYQFISLVSRVGSSGNKLPTIQHMTVAGGKYTFVPNFEPYAISLLKQGAEISGVKIAVRATWTNSAEETCSQDFVYVDSKVALFVDKYDASTGRYDNSFTLTIFGAEEISDMKLQAIIVSETGCVIAANEALALQK